MQIQKEWLDFLREQYPKGSRIRLTEMKDDPYALSPGSMGTLDHIDDAGQFHVKWDNGSGLALIIGEDRFQVQLPEPQTLKFYMPLTAQLYGRDSWGDLEEYGNDLNGRDLRDYQSCIHEALLENQVPEDVIKDRFDRLLSRVQSIAADVCARHEGQVMEVLVEQTNHQEPGLVTGRLGNNTVVHFPGDASMIGKLVSVRLKECKGFYYIGEPYKNEV